MVYFGEHLKTKAFGQTVLPDMSLLIGQKLAENAKIEKLKCDILDDFQTLWGVENYWKSLMSVNLMYLFSIWKNFLGGNIFFSLRTFAFGHQ